MLHRQDTRKKTQHRNENILTRTVTAFTVHGTSCQRSGVSEARCGCIGLHSFLFRAVFPFRISVFAHEMDVSLDERWSVLMFARSAHVSGARKDVQLTVQVPCGRVNDA